MAKLLAMEAALYSGFSEFLFGWSLQTIGEDASLEARWFDYKSHRWERTFLIQPDLFRPFVGPLKGLRDRYEYPMEDLGARVLKVQDGEEEFSVLVSGYGPREYPELQHFDALWRVLERTVKRELEGIVPQYILNLRG
ncbi:hypothetical protein [Planctomyces sp. SH-PL14]|uniref:hypothetical protein n=1 Tax=Planctomyces sp. SH-PL14 TaxID=1632864 RepID=UPI00078D8464|nr:hypothetical protein [Planctomyces sp. SH-PL14]AMV20476.1 hypothetical protein VT03_21440 [Planctomyces sp. SH-PL14]